LRSLNEAERVRGFFRCWTRKEAYLKAIGCGISDEDLATVEVTLLPLEQPAILRKRISGDGGEEWTVIDIEPKDGFMGAVVAEGKDLRCSSMIWPHDVPGMQQGVYGGPFKN
jgi:4'-phosphopantetheinyl transferase